MNGMHLMNAPDDKDFLREKYFKSVGMEESSKHEQQIKTSTLYKIKPQCNNNNIDESPPPPINLLASSNNLVNYANASAFNIKHTGDEQESFDYYNTDAQFNYYNNTPFNTYYNVKQVRNDPNFLPIRSTNNTLLSQNGLKKRPSPILGTPQTPLASERPEGGFMHLRICNLLGHTIDSDPPVPESRPYTIVGNTKIGFPQFRQLKNPFIDPASGITLQAGERVRVTGPSPEPPRGRLRVTHQCGSEIHYIDVPHYHFLRLTEVDVWKSVQSTK